MASISVAALLPEGTIKMPHLIHSQTIIPTNLNKNNKPLKKNQNSSQTLCSWARCSQHSNRYIIKWQTVFKIKWLTQITTKVEVCKEAACRAVEACNNNTVLPWQDTAGSNSNSNSSEECLNKISSKQDTTKGMVANNNTTSNQRIKHHLWEDKILSTLSEGAHNLSNNTINNKLHPSSNRRRSICSDWKQSLYN